MELTKPEHATLIQGVVEIPALSYSSSQIIHEIASRLDIDGFEIKKISIFEDPVAANIEIEKTTVNQRKTLRLLLSKDAHINHGCQKLHVYLTLTQFTRSTKRLELTYRITGVKHDESLRAKSTGMAAAHRIKEKLVSNFQRATSANLTVLPLLGL